MVFRVVSVFILQRPYRNTGAGQRREKAERQRGAQASGSRRRRSADGECQQSGS